MANEYLNATEWKKFEDAVYNHANILDIHWQLLTNFAEPILMDTELSSTDANPGVNVLRTIVVENFITVLWRMLDDSKHPANINLQKFVEAIDENTPVVASGTLGDPEMDKHIQERLKTFRDTFLSKKEYFLEKITEFRKKVIRFRHERIGHYSKNETVPPIKREEGEKAYMLVIEICDLYFRGWHGTEFGRGNYRSIAEQLRTYIKLGAQK